MTIVIEKFETDRKWRFLWLQYINGVNLKQHCQKCLLGKTSKKITNDSFSEILNFKLLMAKNNLIDLSNTYCMTDDLYNAILNNYKRNIN